jgi:cytochrome c oxidase cbb3-type subunit 3
MTDHSPEIDPHSGVETTGHEWDGIKELNNPLPRWWRFIFWGSVVFSIVYWVLMPAWPALPGMQGNTRGVWEHSDRGNVAVAVAEARAERSALGSQLMARDIGEILKDHELSQLALSLGESAFGDNCATCHGSGGRGAKGYPRLADDVWLWGGSLADIEYTVRHGIRNGGAQARFSEMPAFGRDGFLPADQISDLVEYVTSISGRSADTAAAARAAPLPEGMLELSWRRCARRPYEGRAKPDGCGLVVWRRSRLHSPHDLRAAQWRHAGLAGAVRRCDDPCARCLRSLSRGW